MRRTTLLILILLSFQLFAQDSGLFGGSDKLERCLVDLPLDYASKNEQRLQAAAGILANTELIYLTVDKKKGVTFQRVFVVVDQTSKGSTFVYLLSPADHARTGGTKSAMFVNYEPKKQRFYGAACFNEVLLSDSELKSRLKEQ